MNKISKTSDFYFFLARLLVGLLGFSFYLVSYKRFIFMFHKIHRLTDREYRALIGISKKDFIALTLVFSQCEQELKNQAYEDFLQKYDRKPTAGGSPTFKTPSEKLFFTLYYLKTYPTFDVLGFVFNCKGKTAHENLYKCLPILEKALESLNVLPKREFDSVGQFLEFMKENEELVIDATERIHHRKKDYQAQKKFYNGKKKAHTVKNTIISNLSQAVLFVGLTVLGAKHDYKLLQEEFPPSSPWFKKISVWIDLGYIGFAKDYICKKLNIPFKKPYRTKNNPNPELTAEQKAYNKFVSKTRVIVENTIAGIKRYNILVYTFRNKSEWLRDKAIFIAAGLWNFTKNFSFS